ncbi:hypothetical protein D3C80_1830260 [compost metagenome]
MAIPGVLLAATHFWSARRLALVIERAPVGELFDVLQEDQPRAGLVGPSYDHPSEAANLAIARLPALGFAVVAAVGRCPQDADWLALGGVNRINLKHVCHVVLGVGVIGAVHGQGD